LISRDLSPVGLEDSSRTKVETGLPAALDKNSTTAETEAPKKRKKELRLVQRQRKKELEKPQFNVNYKIKQNSEEKQRHCVVCLLWITTARRRTAWSR